MLKAPDKAEGRAIASTVASQLLHLLSSPEQHQYLAFVARLSRSAKVFLVVCDALQCMSIVQVVQSFASLDYYGLHCLYAHAAEFFDEACHWMLPATDPSQQAYVVQLLCNAAVFVSS